MNSQFNKYCLIGFIVACVGILVPPLLLVAIVVCFIGLHDVKRHEERGKSLALVGIFTVVIWIWVCVAIGFFTYRYVQKKVAEYEQQQIELEERLNKIRETGYLELENTSLGSDYLGSGSSSIGSSYLDSRSSSLESKYSKYDGSTVQGSVVLGIVQTCWNDDVSALVITTNPLTCGKTEVVYTYPKSTFDSYGKTCQRNGSKMSNSEFTKAFENARNKGSSHYIGTDKHFKCMVCKDPETQEISGLYFTEL